jgi:hypothetical protein
MDARIYTAALAFGVAVVVGCMWAVRHTTANADSEWGSRDVRGAGYGLPVTAHGSRFQAWSLALLALSALGTLGIYLLYNVQFVQPQGRYLFPALPAISLAVAVGWWSVARRSGAARWAGFALLAAAGLAALWGITHEGINTWSLLIFGGGAALLLAWSLALPRLVGAAQGWTTRLVYALPFAAMAGLSLLALQVFVLPQLR